MKLTHNSAYSNFPDRAVAGLIDWQIGNLIGLYSLMLLTHITALTYLVPSLMSNIAYIWLPTSLLYPLITLSLLKTSGYTPGKYLLGIRIADANQTLLTFRRLIFRELIAKRVSAAVFMLGFFNIAIDPNHQGWHDHFSDSYAYKTDNRIVFGILIALILTGTQIYFGYSVITGFLANTALLGDIQFVFAPLVGMLK